jgi:3-oxoacyl-[acyl-carrier-protein] synthase II
VGESALYIRRGAADVVIAGAAESKLNPMGLLRQNKLGRLCTTRNNQPAEAVRPFDADHDGTVIGEGGGLLILENADHAARRGATLYAEIAGFGAACDPQAIDVERPTAGNLALAVRQAMAAAGIDAGQVDAILTYGTGVPGEDAAEAAEWTAALGERAANLPATSFTGATGSMFAGAGGVQLALAAKMLAEQTVPPTVNFSAGADRCDMNFADQPRETKLEHVVVGAFTVGGQSGATVLRRAKT